MSVSTPQRLRPPPPRRTLRDVLTAPAGRRSKFVVLLVLLGALVLAVPYGDKIADVEDNSSTSGLPRGADSTWVEEQLPSFNRGGVEPMVAVYAREGGLTDTDREAIEADRESLTDFAYRGEVSPVEIAQDGEAAVVTFGLQLYDDSAFDSVPDIRDAVDADLPDGLSSDVTGPAATFYDEIEVFGDVDGMILGMSAGVVALLLLLTYRSPLLWLLPLMSVGIAMVLSQALIYLLAKHADLPVDGQSGGLLPIFVFGVGTDYALLLIARYREELHHHADRHDAMRSAVHRAGPAILASGATVVLGLICLMLADVNSTRSIGAVCAIGVACAAVSMVVVLPLLLVLVGRWVFWPFVPREGGADPSAQRGVWRGVTGLLTACPRRVWSLTAVALAVLAVGSLAVTIGTTDAQQFRDAPESVRGQEVVSAHFPAGRSAPAEVVARAGDVDEVRALAGDVPGVSKVAEPVTSTEGGQSLVSVTLDAAPDSDRAEATVDHLRTALASLGARVGGTTAKAMDVADASRRDASVIIPVALGVILLVLVLLLRALVGPFVLLGSVVLSYGAAFGLGSLVMWAAGFEAVDVSLPLFSFVFLVALGVDYTIFLMSRVREEVTAHGHRDGVLRGLVATGGVITSAGLVLAATFGVLTIMPIVFMIAMGVVVALGVLLDTFVVRTLLVPAVALDLGRHFWAPSRLSRGRPGRTLP